jgi:hypothetical protein
LQKRRGEKERNRGECENKGFVEENLRREGRGKRSQSKEKNLCFFKERRKKNKSEEARAA